MDISGSDALRLPAGTTLERPSGVAGYTRFNSDTKGLEYYDGTQWIPVNMEQTPIGTIAPYGGNVAPAGWMICNGAGINTSTYSDLFAVIGYTYGGSGSTFNLPDLRGKTTFGRGSSAPFTTLGNTGGSISQTPSLSHSLAVDIANINVPLPNHTHNVPGHYHGIGSGAGLSTSASNTGGPSSNSTSSAGAHTHNWGSHWSVDDSRIATGDNGDGAGNTLSDGAFWWGHSSYPSQQYYDFPGGALAAGNHTHGIASENDTDNGSVVARGDLGSGRDATAYTDAAGYHSHSIRMYAHRHWIKSRPTTSAGGHTHNLNNHTHSIPSLTVNGNIGLVSGGQNGNSAFASGNPNTNPNISVDPPSTGITGTVTSNAVDVTNPYQVINYIIKVSNTSSPSIVAVNIPTGTSGQTLYNNGSGWQATSNLYNSGTNVGIGSTSPSAALSVGSGNPFQVNSSGAVAAATGITSSGNITFSNLNVNNGFVRTNGSGLLSTSPLSTSDIPAGSVTADNGLTVNTGNNVQLGGTLGAATDIALGGNDFTFSGSGNIGIGGSPSYKLDVIGGTIATDNYLRVNSWPGYGSGFFRIWHDGAGGSGTGAGLNRTYFDVNGNSNAMVIEDNGNVGIGNSSPGAKLDINASDTGPGGWYKAIEFSQSAHSAITHPGGGLLFGMHGNRNFYFADVDGGTFQKYVMTIEAPSGDVGIGTSNPTERLHVIGNAKIDGTKIIGGSGSSSSYGAITVQGEDNGWGGIHFTNAAGTNLKTLMIGGAISGVYDGGWDWYFNGGTLTVGTVPWARVSGNVPLSRVYADYPGSYGHLGGWAGTWNTNNSVLVNGAYYWWGQYPSARDLKKNISRLEDSRLEQLTDELLNANLYSYEYTDSPEGLDIPRIGMMADEAPAPMQMPDQKSINIIDGFMMSVAALKVLQQEKQELEKRVDELEKRLSKLE